MLIILSPSKTLDYNAPVTIRTHTQPALLEHTNELISLLRKLSTTKLQALMDISPKLAQLNAERYQTFSTPFTPKNARQALLAFKGDVYEGVKVEDYSAEDFSCAQNHLRILSGLYGVLRPLDLMQPYRLEMGTALKNQRGKNLYAFWGEHVTQQLNGAMKTAKTNLLINLASEEYFTVVRPGALKGDIITPVFKERSGNQLKTIGLFAKKARGLMASYIIRNRITMIEDLLQFNAAGYAYDKHLSDNYNIIFTRQQPARA